MTEKLKRIKAFLEEDPQDAFLNFALAKEYEAMDDWPLAIAQYEGILERDPKYIGAYYHLAKAYEHQTKNAKALGIYAAGIAMAQELKDLHALSELNSAKQNLELDLE